MRVWLTGSALLALAGLLQPSTTTFTVGVLRRDALVVPFATYDGKEWKNHWPAAAEKVDVPLSLRSINKRWWGPTGPRETWQVWTLDASPHVVSVRQPDWVSSYCHKAVGLRTDYQPRLRPPPPGVNPYPKDGLAISPPHPVEAIEVLGPDSPERHDVVEGVHARFTELELDLLANLRRLRTGSPRQFPETLSQKDLRALPPMAIDALYAYGTSRRTYFVEGAREYKWARTCLGVILLRGLVSRESGKFSTRGLRVSLTACDRGTATYMLPLGVISVPTGVYWIAQTSGWTRESYSIIDINPRSKTEDVATPGGGC